MCTKHTSSWMDGYGRTIARLVLGEGHVGRAGIVANATSIQHQGRSRGGHSASIHVDSKEWAPVPATATLVEQRYDAPPGRVIYQRTPGISIVTWTFEPGNITIRRGPDGGTPVPVEMHTNWTV